MPSMFQGYLSDAGFLTLSRFPIVESEFKLFKVGAFTDSKLAKGVLYTKIQVRNSFIHVFNTHLQATYLHDDTRRMKTSVENREAQLMLIRDFINQKVDKHCK